MIYRLAFFICLLSSFRSIPIPVQPDAESCPIGLKKAAAAMTLGCNVLMAGVRAVVIPLMKSPTPLPGATAAKVAFSVSSVLLAGYTASSEHLLAIPKPVTSEGKIRMAASEMAVEAAKLAFKPNSVYGTAASAVLSNSAQKGLAASLAYFEGIDLTDQQRRDKLAGVILSSMAGAGSKIVNPVKNPVGIVVGKNIATQASKQVADVAAEGSKQVPEPLMCPDEPPLVKRDLITKISPISNDKAIELLTSENDFKENIVLSIDINERACFNNLNLCERNILLNINRMFPDLNIYSSDLIASITEDMDQQLKIRINDQMSTFLFSSVTTVLLKYF